MEWEDTKDANQVGDYHSGPGRGTRVGAEGADWELIDETGPDKNKFITLGEQGRGRHQRHRYGLSLCGAINRSRSSRAEEVWEESARV